MLHSFEDRTTSSVSPCHERLCYLCKDGVCCLCRLPDLSKFAFPDPCRISWTQAACKQAQRLKKRQAATHL